MHVIGPSKKTVTGTVSPVASASSVFNIPHGLGTVPTFFSVTPKNLLSAALFYITADNTNLTITYTVSLTGTLSLGWLAVS